MEVMTLIKHYKPAVFWGIKKMSQGNVMLNLLTHLTTDLETAEAKLEKILNDDSYISICNNMKCMMFSNLYIVNH